MANEVMYQVKEVFGVISSYKNMKGEERTKEVRKVSWNGRNARLDIRDWDAINGVPGKGISLSFHEARVLRDILNEVIVDEQ